MDQQTVIEDRICATLMVAVFLSLFLLTVDLTKVDPWFATPPPACEYNCR